VTTHPAARRVVRPPRPAGSSAEELRRSVLAHNGAFAVLEEVDAVIDEGDLHTGRAHVLNAVWVKATLME